MKKMILLLMCASIFSVGCKQKSSQTETQSQSQEQTDLQEYEIETMPLCQSCGMPLTDDLYGKNADGSLNYENCKYCYENGAYTATDITMAEMIEICIPHMVDAGMEDADARKMMEELLPTLKRWATE
ncbi:MAG: zinc ribbon domain-containing protein [Prevotellaceae bacterium]|jgi:hypothetical protein|nr:zinc ribbon domain-containing protein [Prevotellaceae bacterium]